MICKLSHEILILRVEVALHLNYSRPLYFILILFTRNMHNTKFPMYIKFLDHSRSNNWISWLRINSSQNLTSHLMLNVGYYCISSLIRWRFKIFEQWTEKQITLIYTKMISKSQILQLHIWTRRPSMRVSHSTAIITQISLQLDQVCMSSTKRQQDEARGRLY